MGLISVALLIAFGILLYGAKLAEKFPKVKGWQKSLQGVQDVLGVVGIFLGLLGIISGVIHLNMFAISFVALLADVILFAVAMPFGFGTLKKHITTPFFHEKGAIVVEKVQANSEAFGLGALLMAVVLFLMLV